MELYDLKDDIGETKDLAAKRPDVVKRLHGKLKAWQKQVDAKMPTENPNRK